MTPERLLSPAEHQALELIESRLERDDRRLAARMAYGFEERQRWARFATWAGCHRLGLALVTAVVLASASALPAGGLLFAAAVSATSALGAGAVAGAAWAWHRWTAARLAVPNH